MSMSSAAEPGQNHLASKQAAFSLTLIISLFFLWALTSNLLPVLIPHLKKATGVNTLQASLVDSAYWVAYFLLAIPAGMMMKRLGYKTTIIAGLLLAAAGAFLFPLAADSRSFGFFLFALFVVASGMTFLETSANPYIREFGSADSYSQRLNFAQAFNGLGAVVATNLLNRLILSDDLVKKDEELLLLSDPEKDLYYANLFGSVKIPYMVIGATLLIFAVLFLFARLSAAHKLEKQKIQFFNPLKFPDLSRSMLAQFFYVGAQVCLSSFFILYAEKSGGLTLNSANTFLGLLLIFFMAGRYVGAFLMKKYAPALLLLWFALGSILLSVVIVFIGGMPGVIAFLGVEFFMSIMYPTIFSLGIRDMKEKTEIASAYLVMMIVGGAFLPPLQGMVADAFSIQVAYAVPLICFVLIALYARKAHQPMIV
ncbi:MAG: L-fucose:H+ symporter permease [Saprospiraceae bacterium]|nr:L-fucose:H+ symporter permease [Saprospiraceae bacterium]